MTLHSTSAPIQERRRFSRHEPPAPVTINLLRPHGVVPLDQRNFSEGGICVRLEEMLEVRSLVRLQVMTAGRRSLRSRRLVECTGRITWIMQRLDLRDAPPFVFDVGIEFVDPPPMLRQLMAQRSGQLASLRTSATTGKSVEPTAIKGRQFLPQIERTANQPLPWHLVVSVDGIPCFSGHYASERAAKAAWALFQRQQAKR